MLAPRRRIRITAGVLGGMLALLVALGAWNGLRPLPVVQPHISSLPSRHSTATMTWPGVGEAAIGAVGYGVLATSGTQKPLPTASVAKVMVSLAVLQKLPLKAGEQGPSFTITQTDVDRYDAYVALDGSVIPVVIGEQLTEYQALQALMLPSANNIADSLAIWVFGSLDNYFAYARQMTADIGMTQTVLGGDASGLSPITVSTPEDLVKLGQAAMANPVLAQIVGLQTAELPVVGSVFNYNSVLGAHGVVGIKTGNSDEAGGCFLFAAKYNMNGKDVTVVGAIMGTTDLGAALRGSLPVLDAAQANFSVITPVHKGDVLASYQLPWGKTAQAVAEKDISLLAWNGTSITSTADAHTIQGEQIKGAKVGQVQVVAGGQELNSDLILKESIPGPSVWWRITRH